MSELPEYYFRIRENGAIVFRVDVGNRARRLEMNELASVNTRNGSIKPMGDQTLTGEEMALIEDWIAERRAVLAEREMEDIHRTIDHLNLCTYWAQSRASDADIEEVADRLLLAMHDLRNVLIRRKSKIDSHE